jgi:ATP-dependent DNA helicase PIF1
MLSPEQEFALSQFNKGHNLMISGAGGSGKSYLINILYQNAVQKRKNVQVCALTGCASLLLNNCKSKTLHSWAGIGLAKEDNDIIIERVSNHFIKKKIWKNIEILIIDEVSMLSVKLFELLDGIGKRCKRNFYPFGGIQIVLTGDFYQLKCIEEQGNPDTGKFCFESNLWNDTFSRENHIILKTIFRQTDPVFTNILNQVRLGYIDEENIAILSSLMNRERDINIPICKVFPINDSVMKENKLRYDELTSEEHTFNMQTVLDYPMDKITYPHTVIISEINRLKQGLLCCQEIKLKVGTVVMHLKNDDEKGLSNGSIGKVISINKYPVVDFGNAGTHEISYNSWESSDLKGIFVSQLPLMLAWGTTINKIQGSTLSSIEIDIGPTIFTYAQAYVALSRVKSLDGLYIKAFDPRKIKANPIVTEFYNRITA